MSRLEGAGNIFELSLCFFLPVVLPSFPRSFLLSPCCRNYVLPYCLFLMLTLVFLIYVRESLGASIACSNYIKSSSEVSSPRPWLLHGFKEHSLFSCFRRSIIVSTLFLTSTNIHLTASTQTCKRNVVVNVIVTGAITVIITTTTETLPRHHQDTTETPPRCHRDTTETPSRCHRHTTEGSPKHHRREPEGDPLTTPSYRYC